MNLLIKFKFLFLFVIVALFSYRATLLQQHDGAMSFYAQTMLSLDEARASLIFMLAEAIPTKQESKEGASAANTHNYANKYNTQLEHHAYMIASLVEKNNCDEVVLKKIEHELLVLEQTVQALNIAKLINQPLIESIKKSISYLRMLDFSTREKVNNI